MLEYRTAIVDECGDIIAWCDNLSHEERNQILEENPEWSVQCVQW